MTPPSILVAAETELTPADRRDLEDAVAALDRPNFVARLADYAAQPVDAVTKFLPRSVNTAIRHAVRSAIFKCLEVALQSLDSDSAQPSSELTGRIVTGVTGGLGGLFGMAALPFELPLTTVLMLRSIAEIARDEGEDLSTVEAKLACIEVFALGARRSGDKADIDYFAVRTVLARLTADAAAFVVERGALNASSPAIARFTAEIVSRFGLVVSERVAAGAVPVIGAVGGATVNVLFMSHFQRVARGHFVIRRLERTYNAALIRDLYHRQSALVPAVKPAAARSAPDATAGWRRFLPFGDRSPGSGTTGRD